MDETTQMLDHIATQRWMIENGLLNDFHRDTLYMYGSIVHKDVIALDVYINLEQKTVTYNMFLTGSLLKLLEKYNKLSKSQSFWGLWKFRRLLQKDGNLNFQGIISRFVKDYCGPSWHVVVNLKNEKLYKEGKSELVDEETQQHTTKDKLLN